MRRVIGHGLMRVQIDLHVHGLCAGNDARDFVRERDGPLDTRLRQSRLF